MENPKPIHGVQGKVRPGYVTPSCLGQLKPGMADLIKYRFIDEWRHGSLMNFWQAENKHPKKMVMLTNIDKNHPAIE